ncbi:hypothetical protein SK128_008496, partial [Halocaridina rubra]
DYWDSTKRMAGQEGEWTPAPVRTWPQLLPFLLLLRLYLLFLHAEALNMETCDGKPHQVTLNPQAEVYL